MIAAMHPSDIKILCPRDQKRKDRGEWHQPISCQDCRLLNALMVVPTSTTGTKR